MSALSIGGKLFAKDAKVFLYIEKEERYRPAEYYTEPVSFEELKSVDKDISVAMAFV